MRQAGILAMKPNRLAAEKERKAKVKFRRLARKIRDNAMLVNILLSFPDKPFRGEFLRRVAPHLKFTPIQLEDLDHHV